MVIKVYFVTMYILYIENETTYKNVWATCLKEQCFNIVPVTSNETLSLKGKFSFI